MEGTRRRLRLLAGALTGAVGLLAGTAVLIAAPAQASTKPTVAGASSGCGPASCTYTRTGQSLFRVPPGVTLLEVDVIGAGASATSTSSPAARAPRKDEAVEVQGNLALPQNMTTLEVVVGGKNTLGGTTSEIMTSTDSTSQVLVAADGVPVPVGTKAAKQAKHARSAHPRKKAKAAADRPVATPTRVPAGGTEAAARGPARVVISWQTPGQAPRWDSSRFPVLTAGKTSTFVIHSVAATVPALSELGALPLGLTFHDQGNGTAAIEGVPLVDGVYRLKVLAVASADPPATQHLVLVVRGGMVRLGSATHGGRTEESNGVKRA